MRLQAALRENEVTPYRSYRTHTHVALLSIGNPYGISNGSARSRDHRG